jgi:hypothetical protein
MPLKRRHVIGPRTAIGRRRQQRGESRAFDPALNAGQPYRQRPGVPPSCSGSLSSNVQFGPSVAPLVIPRA